MANDSNGHKGANIWPWALVTGLAVGFLVGREIGGRGGESTPREPARVAQVAAGADAKYKNETQFPANWLKAADLATVTSFDGMSDAQKALAMQALNERNCECGCGKGSVAFCAKNDTACPKSPQLVKQVVALAKEGKSLADVLAYLDRENPPKGGGGAAAPAPAPGPKKVALPAHAPRKGPKHAKVTIVEFSDFQCPFCSRVNPTLAQISKTYPNDVAIVFVNQPLAFHDRAEPAGRAFLAAARQGKGWEMHDKLFANQQALSDADLEKYAAELKLNVAKWKTDYQSSELKEQVKADQTLANSVGANGTPTFFINGRELVGAQPFEQFKSVIDEEIKKADELLKKGVKADQLYEKLMEQAAAAPAPGGGGKKNDDEPGNPQAKVAIDVGSSPVKGPKNAPITVVAFSDFECPFCSRVVPTLKQIEDEYKGKVRVAFKNLPLPFHANAQVAAEAALAANEQGKFWEMHDKLFENQRQLDRLSLEKYAQDLGLNLAKFKQALDSGKYKDQVQKDSQQAATVGATGTPTFFINGRSLVGAQPFAEFKKVIDEELAAKK